MDFKEFFEKNGKSFCQPFSGICISSYMEIFRYGEEAKRMSDEFAIWRARQNKIVKVEKTENIIRGKIRTSFTTTLSVMNDYGGVETVTVNDKLPALSENQCLLVWEVPTASDDDDYIGHLVGRYEKFSVKPEFGGLIFFCNKGEKLPREWME